MSEQALTLNSEYETARLAASIGTGLGPGDVILLEGPVGAGKTHFARALIKSILLKDEDVPSPTFTLVQVYETRLGPLWHTDLYRISSDHEIEELGLAEAFDTAICLVEWPDRLGPLRPAHALTISFRPAASETTREVHIQWNAARWDAVAAEAQDA